MTVLSDCSEASNTGLWEDLFEAVGSRRYQEGNGVKRRLPDYTQVSVLLPMLCFRWFLLNVLFLSLIRKQLCGDIIYIPHNLPI